MTGTTATSFPIFAAAAAKYDALVVSVHDVAPATRAISEKIIAELARHGVRVSSLLVVPNYHHRGVSMDDRDFVRWLRDLEAEGHEIVIHGYFHQRPRRDSETLRAKMITRNYTSDEGEFYDLSYDEALQRITQARDEFTAAGLKPRGFIAPAWLLGKEAERAAKDAEMEYTTRLTTVRDLRTAQTFAARSLVYSVAQFLATRGEPGLEWRARAAHVDGAFAPARPPPAGFRTGGNLAADHPAPGSPGGDTPADHLSRLDCRETFRDPRSEIRDPMSRCDLHVHSRSSERSEEWLFRRFDLPDSYSHPKELYAALRAKGMDFVTITDHDTIEGCLQIADLPNTFISEQVTTYFPQDPCKIHLLVWGITEAQHAEIVRTRDNIFELQSYLQTRVDRACGRASALQHQRQAGGRRIWSA